MHPLKKCSQMHIYAVGCISGRNAADCIIYASAQRGQRGLHRARFPSFPLYSPHFPLIPRGILRRKTDGQSLVNNADSPRRNAYYILVEFTQIFPRTMAPPGVKEKDFSHHHLFLRIMRSFWIFPTQYLALSCCLLRSILGNAYLKPF